MTDSNHPRETQATRIALMQKDISDIQSDIKSIRYHLEGNGKKGLLERTAEVERILTDHLKAAEQEAREKKEAKAGKKDISVKLVLLLIGSVIAQLVSTVFNLLTLKGGTP